MASAIRIIELTNTVASTLRSSVLQVFSPETREVGGKLGGNEPNLGADSVAQHRDAAGALAGDEAPVLALLGTLATRMSTDDSITRLGSSLPGGARAPQHVAQGPERLVDEDQSEGLHRFEVTENAAGTIPTARVTSSLSSAR